MIITTVTEGDTAVISPHGEIDFETLPDLLAAARHLPRAVTRVVWDLHQADFMDVAGLHLLARQRLACLEARRTLSVTGLGRQAQHLLALAQDTFPAWNWDDFAAAEAPAPAARVA